MAAARREEHQVFNLASRKALGGGMASTHGDLLQQHGDHEEMHGQENENEALERILNDASAEPIMLSYKFLQSITENFSKDREIGTGGFGVVYMGIVRNMKVAIKKLSRIDDFSEKHFEDELKCLKRVKHKNIVRLLGYCSETPKEVAIYNGTYVMAEYRIRILCFEYVPNNSLEDYIKDESRERDWVTSYHLIEGVCQGLYYLHNKERINHLDLKPANILLDADMVPKISDFGLSRRFSGERSRIITEHIRGTPGYIAPEYLDKGEISFKTDIYSLGNIMMKLLMVRNDNLFDAEGLLKSADKDCPQMERCIKIAQLCMDPDQQRRPTIDNIVDMLNVKESMKDDARPSLEQVRSHMSSTASNLLDIHPRELRFPFKLNEVIRCPVSLTNTTDRYVGVWITPTNTEQDIYKPLECSLIHPHSTWVVSMEMEKQQQLPRRNTEEFEVLMIAMGLKDDIRGLKSSFRNSNELSRSRDFWKRIKELGGEMHVTMLTTVICEPGSDEAGKNKVISRGQLGRIFCMDVHPTQARILTGHEGGFVSIWSYPKQEREMALQVAKQATYPVYSVKFIARENWFAAAVDHGHVRVHDYTSTTKKFLIKKIRAHDGKRVTSLAVHPTYPYLLTSSRDDNSIKLWDWGQGRWSCARTFDGHTGGVRSLTFSRWDINSFASVGCNGGEAKVWNIQSSKPKSTVVGPDRVDYLRADSARNLLVASCDRCAYIWDFQAQEFIHKLDGHGFTICDVASHPTLPILATRSRDGTVCFWDTGTYRLEKNHHLPLLGDFVDLALIGTPGLTRVLVGGTDGIAIMEIDLLGKASCSVSMLSGEVQSNVVCAPPLDSTRSSEVDFHETTSRKVIDIYSQEFCFPFKPNDHLQYPVTLTNGTDHYVGVWITPKGANLWVNKSLENPCSFFLMKPNSTWVATMTTKKQQQLPPLHTSKFEMTMIVMGAEHDHSIFESPNGSNLLKLVEESGGKLPQAMLTATIYNPTNRNIVKIHQIVPARKFGCVFSIDVHLTEPWILTGHEDGFVSIWNYETQQSVKSFKVITSSVFSVKFIVRDQMIAVVAGDANGWVHVINNCFETDKIKRFEAHPGKHVDSLAVHSTSPILLSSSREDSKIMLWEWDQSWVCTRIFQGHISGVRSLAFNPRDINTFASVGVDNDAKVWNINNSSSDIIPLSVEPQKVDYFFTGRNGHFAITCEDDQIANAEIWDLQTKDHLQTLAVFMRSNLHKNEVGVDSSEIPGQVHEDAKNNGKKDSGEDDHPGSSSHATQPDTQMGGFNPQNYSMFSDENPNACSVM